MQIYNEFLATVMNNTQLLAITYKATLLSSTLGNKTNLIELALLLTISSPFTTSVIGNL